MTTRELLTTCWQIDPFGLVASFGALALYFGLARLRGDKLGGRAAYFVTAVLLFAFALVSPIGVLANGYLFSAHMLHHLILVLVVPPLLLLGLTPKAGEPHPLSRMLLRPIVAWGLGVGAMWLWHAPTLCNAASTSAVVQRLQQLSLVGMGTAFWWPIVSPRTEARLSPLGGVLYLFTACVACTLLGVIVTFSPVEVCSVFLHPVDRLGVMPLVRERWGLTVEKDQQIGGLIMWVPACLVYGAGILGLLARMYRNDGDEPVGDATELATKGAS